MEGGNANTRLKNEIASYQSTKGKLQHAPEMEAIGLLTAGIAHDFNNLLMAVGGSAELLSTGLGPGSASLSHIATIMQAVKRGATLAGQLLALGRKETLVPRSADDLRKVSSDTVSVQAARKLSSRPGPVASVFNSSNKGRRILVSMTTRRY